MIDQKNPVLNEDQIKDLYVRNNFKNLNTYFREQNQFLDFKFFDLAFDKKEDNRKVEHGFKYIPQDILVSKITGKGIVSFNHGLFDNKYINISSTDSARIRFFVGSYWNADKPKSNEAKDAVTEYRSSADDTEIVTGTTTEKTYDYFHMKNIAAYGSVNTLIPRFDLLLKSTNGGVIDLVNNLREGTYVKANKKCSLSASFSAFDASTVDMIAYHNPLSADLTSYGLGSSSAVAFSRVLAGGQSNMAVEVVMEKGDTFYFGYNGGTGLYKTCTFLAKEI